MAEQIQQAIIQVLLPFPTKIHDIILYYLPSPTRCQKQAHSIYSNLLRDVQQNINKYLSDWYFEGEEYDQDEESVWLLRHYNSDEFTYPSIHDIVTRSENSRVPRYYNSLFESFIPLPDVFTSFPYWYYRYSIYKINNLTTESIIESEEANYDHSLYNWEA